MRLLLLRLKRTKYGRRKHLLVVLKAEENMCLKATKPQNWKAFAAKGTNLLFYLMLFSSI